MSINWKDKFNWMGAAFAVVPVLIVCNRIGQYFELSKADWAAWIQAFGSIAAIIGAVAISNKNARDSEKARMYEKWHGRSVFALAGSRLAESAYDALHTVEKKMTDSERDVTYFQFGTERIEDLQRSLRAFVSKDIPAEVFREILRVQTEVAYTLTALIECNASGNVSSQRLQNAIHRVQAVSACARRLSMQHRKFVEYSRDFK